MIDVTQLHPKIDFSLVCGTDPAVQLRSDMVLLLREVEHLGSLNAAAKSLRVSYSHSLNALAALEETLGVSLVVRIRPTGSYLTEEGKQLVDYFEQAQKRLIDYASQSL